MVTVRLDPDSGIRAFITLCIDPFESEVLVLTDTSIHPLLGISAFFSADANDLPARLKLGPALELLQRRTSDGRLLPFTLPAEEEFWRAACDATTGMVYIGTKSLIYQLDPNTNTMTQLVGAEGEEESIDGPGSNARVDRPFCMVADGHGSLLIKDCGSSRVRRLVLPSSDSPLASSPLVITLGPDYAANLWAVAMDYSTPQRLYVATKTAVYRHDRLPYSTPAPSLVECAEFAAALEVAEDYVLEPSDDPALAPMLLAGHEGDNSRTDGVVSGLQSATPNITVSAAANSTSSTVAGASRSASSTSPSTARFSHITYMVVDSSGRLILVERDPHDDKGEPCLRIVWPSGLVTSFLADYDVTGSEFVMAVLPGGWLALHAWDDTRVQLLSLGPGLIPSLPPSTAGGDTAAEMGPAEAAAAAAEAGLPGLPGLEGLAADLAALLDVGVRSGCEGSSGGVGGGSAGADVTVVVGDRSFLCHRAILGARCEYFRRLFQSNFVDSCCSKVALPDADPDAFQLLLRYLYSSAMDFPAQLLRPLAELADRLLLPAASRTAQLQLLAATGPTSVVDDLLWAECRGFSELLMGLKDYYLVNAHRVLEEAPVSLELLMTSSPKLHLELYAAGIKRARRKV